MRVECEACSDSVGRTLQIHVTATEDLFTRNVFQPVSVITARNEVGARGRGHAWQGHVWHGVVHGSRCAWQGGWHAWQILRDTVNERAVRILLECILVTTIFIRITAVTHFVHYSHRHHWHNTKL